MRIGIIGDIHGRRHWEKFWLLLHQVDHLVFMGDYFDSKSISSVDQLINLAEIIRFKKTFRDKITLLLGNHDYSYINPVLYQCAGWDAHLIVPAAELFSENKELFTNAIELDGWLYTHAGVSASWLDRYNKDCRHLSISDQINTIIETKPLSLSFYSNQGRTFSSSGDDVTQSPIWIRPESLSKVMAYPDQVVGHTQQSYPKIMTNGKERMLLTDSPDYYTVLDNGELSFYRF